MNQSKIAYICDGYAHCSMHPGCFMREDPVGPTDMVCRHTCDPQHAVNGVCLHPEKEPERFAGFPEFQSVKYYERLPGEGPLPGEISTKGMPGALEVLNYYERGPDEEL